MARKHLFLNADFSERWNESYQSLQQAQRNGADKVVIALLKQMPTPGMRVKPVELDKYYYEARINDGDRIIHRTYAGTVYFIDIVTHDDIAKYASPLAGIHKTSILPEIKEILQAGARRTGP